MMRMAANDKGMALLVTVLVVSILYVLIIQFNKTMRSNLFEATNTSEGVALMALARSGINVGRAVLTADGAANRFDTLHELWADSAQLDAGMADLTGSGEITIRISDHSGLIQLNALGSMNSGQWVRNEDQIELMRNFLKSDAFGLEQETVESILATLIDWLDPDDEETGFRGAESDYYQNQAPGHACKNGPIESVEELLSIKGITPEIYYGTADRPGIARYLTPYGHDGRINLNTAGPEVLLALSGQLSRDLVEGLVAYRADRENDLSVSSWYQKVPGFPSPIRINPNRLTTTGSFFEVRVVATRNGMRKTADAVLHREPADGKTDIVFWKTE